MRGVANRVNHICCFEPFGASGKLANRLRPECFHFWEDEAGKRFRHLQAKLG